MDDTYQATQFYHMSLTLQHHMSMTLQHHVSLQYYVSLGLTAGLLPLV